VKLSNFKELYLGQVLSDLDGFFDQLLRITYVILSPVLGNGARNDTESRLATTNKPAIARALRITIGPRLS